MPVLFRDIETRSTLDLKAVGAWRYAAEPTTDVWCVGFAIDDDPVEIWTPGQPIPDAFIEAARNPDWLVVAHNDAFERAIEELVLAPRYSWLSAPIERHRCTMATALAAALPGALDAAAEALDSPFRKDTEGQRLMRLMARPRKPRPDEDPNGLYWHDEAKKQSRLQTYCKRDVEGERWLYQHALPLTDDEQALWALDAAINARGFYVDGALLDAAHHVVTEAEAALQVEFRGLTGLESTNQTAKLIAWLGERGCEVADVQKGTLKHALRRKSLEPAVRRVIELRLQLAHASAGKIEALLNWRNGDGRVRGTLQFHGAATGRWVGRGPQPQNFRRDSGGIDAKITAVMNGGGGLDSPVETVGDIARAMIVAAPGHRFLIGDFSGIESRILAWISGQQSKLDQWMQFDRTGDANDDPYVIGGRSFGHPESTARAFGKIGDLAFGFQGGGGAWKNFAPEDDASDEATIKQYRDKWRADHPRSVEFWHVVDRAAINAVQHPGVEYQVRQLTFRFEQPFLRIKLPSGRALSYPFPRIAINRFDHSCVVFKDSAGGKWRDCNFGRGAYGGLWTENIVSGIARDLLAGALQRLASVNYSVVLHVHDEIVCEMPDGVGNLEEFRRLLTALPDWAEGLPIAAKVRVGQRFSKPSAPAGEPIELEAVPSVPELEPSSPELAPIAPNSEPEPTAAETKAVTAGDALDELLGGEDGGDGSTGEDELEFNGSGNDADLGIADFTTIEPAAAPELAVILSVGNTGDRIGEQENDHNSGAGSGASPGAGDGAAADIGGNRHDQNAGRHRGNYGDRYSEAHTGKPYAPVRARLLALGYRLTQTFSFTVPGETEPRFYEDRWELSPGITPTAERPRKTCRFRHRVNGQDHNDTGPRRVIYNWPAILRAGRGAIVFITEGANKSEALIAKGLLATAVPYHRWEPECVDALAGYHLIYLADHCNPLRGWDAHDNDPAARYAEDAKQKLASRAASFRIVPAAHLWKNLPPGTRAIELGDDVVDWLELGGNAARLLGICREISAEGGDDPVLLHGEPDPRPRQKWRIKNLMPTVGVGLLPGQWGAFKTFMAIELATTVIEAGREFCGRKLVEPCAVLFLLTEGAFDFRDRLDAAVREKCTMDRAPISWRESCPTLLGEGAADALIRKIQEAAAEIKRRFNLPLGLVFIDVLTDAAGYKKAGDENDPAIGARIFNTLRRAAEACECFILVVDHFGKDLERGTRGSSAKEGAADLVMACLGEREVSGTVNNTRLALRKVRGGPQGQEFPFKPQVVEVLESTEDGSETTCIINWQAGAPPNEDDQWENAAGRQAQAKLAMRTLRRAMMKLLAEHGVVKAPELGMVEVRMIDQELVRKEFYDNTAVDGDVTQKQNARRQRFNRVLDRAEEQRLIKRREIERVTYLWFINL
jgi:DNA polymerase bacteriophage-type